MSEMKWIPVTERLPDEGIDVLTQEIDGNMFVGWYDKVCGWCDSEFCNLNQVVAWMPLPEPYQK